MRDMNDCPECNSSRTSVSNEKETFQYGAGKDEAHLIVTIPVHTCETCSLQWTDCDAADIKDQAVTDYLKWKVRNEEI